MRKSFRHPIRRWMNAGKRSGDEFHLTIPRRPRRLWTFRVLTGFSRKRRLTAFESAPPFLQVVTWSSVAYMTAAMTKRVSARFHPPVLHHDHISWLTRPKGFSYVPSPRHAFMNVGMTHIKGGLGMHRRQGSRAVQLTACRHPACLPRAGLPEAGRRVPWDASMTMSMSWPLSDW